MKTNRNDLIIVTESHCNIESEKNIQLKGYQLYLSPTTKSRSAGIAIYVKENIDVVVLENINLTSILSNIIVIKIRCDLEFYTIIAIYRSPSFKYELFMDQLQLVLNKYNQERVILTGDFNVDTNKNTNRTKEFLLTIAAFNLQQRITQLTHMSRKSKTIIENVFTKK